MLLGQHQNLKMISLNILKLSDFQKSFSGLLYSVRTEGQKRIF